MFQYTRPCCVAVIGFGLIVFGYPSRDTNRQAMNASQAAEIAAEEATTAKPDESAGSVKVAYPKYVPADCDNLWYLGDVLPHLNRLLSSDVLRKTFLEGKLAAALPRSDTPLDPRLLLVKIRENSRFVPQEVVLGLPAKSLDDLARLMKAGLLMRLRNGAGEAGEKQIEGDLPGLHDDLLSELKQLTVPQMTVWVQFREDAVAAQLFQQIRAVLVSMLDRPGVELTDSDDRFGWKTRLGSLMEAKQLSTVLFLTGIAPDPQDGALRKMGRTLAKLNLEFWFERFDDGLRLTLGPPSKGASEYDVAQLGELWQPDPTLFMFGRWNIAAFNKRVSGVLETWREWKDTPTGRATEALDEEDMLGDLERLVRQLRGTADRGTFRLTVGASVEAVSHSRGLQPASSLSDSGVMDLIPADAEMVVLDTRASMADHFSNRLADSEERMAKNSLKYELGDNVPAAAMNQKVIDFYYGKMAEFRRLIHKESHEVFERPVAILGGSKCKIRELSIEFEQPAGKANRIVLRDAPIVEYAVIGRCADADRALQFPANVWKAALSSFLDDPPKEVTERVDLGLGVKTYAFGGAFWKQLPHKIRVKVSGDLLPHYFVEDGWFVFSTSTRLSKLILDAKRGDSQQRFNLPDDGGPPPIAYGRIPAGTLAAYMELFGQLLGDFFSRGGRFTLEGPVFEEETPAELQQVTGIVAGLGEVIRLVDRIQWRTVDRTSYRETRWQVMMAGQ